MQEALISVVIPSYNSAHYITATLDSVLAQTYPNFEILLIDDGSKDNTREVVERYEDARIRYVFQENSGVAAARNNGIKLSKGKYIAFLDADDFWLPEKLERQVNALEKSDSKACYTAFTIGDKDLKPLSINYSKRFGTTLEDLLLYGGNAVGTPSTVIVESELLKKTGGFDLNLSHGADWEMWIRLAAHTEFLYIEEPLIIYRTHESNMSKNAILQEKDCVLVMEKGFSMPELPESIKNKRNKAFAATYMVLAGNYFHAGMYKNFLRCTVKSVYLETGQVSYLLNFPIRLIASRFANKSKSS